MMIVIKICNNNEKGSKKIKYSKYNFLNIDLITSSVTKLPAAMPRVNMKMFCIILAI